MDYRLLCADSGPSAFRFTPTTNNGDCRLPRGPPAPGGFLTSALTSLLELKKHMLATFSMTRFYSLAQAGERLHVRNEIIIK